MRGWFGVVALAAVLVPNMSEAKPVDVNVAPGVTYRYESSKWKVVSRKRSSVALSERTIEERPWLNQRAVDVRRHEASMSRESRLKAFIVRNVGFEMSEDDPNLSIDVRAERRGNWWRMSYAYGDASNEAGAAYLTEVGDRDVYVLANCQMGEASPADEAAALAGITVNGLMNTAIARKP